MADDPSIDGTARARKSLLRHLRGCVSRKYMPRFFMFVIITIVLGVIYYSSRQLLAGGMETMWSRYIVADAIGYAVFILLLWLWVHFEGGDWIDAGNLPDGSGGSSHGACGAADPAGQAAGHAVGHAAEGGVSFFDSLGIFADLEGLVFVVALMAAAAVIFIITYNVWMAPDILAELMLDAGLAAVLSRRVRGIKPEGFFRSALRQTFPAFAGFAFVMVIVAHIIALKYPEAHSLGEAIHMSQSMRP